MVLLINILIVIKVKLVTLDLSYIVLAILALTYRKAAADIISSYASSHAVEVGQLPQLLAQAFYALGKDALPLPITTLPDKRPRHPAVPIIRSVTRDYIVCLEDGAKVKSLKRHLTKHHKLSVSQYREKWELPANYPTVAPSLSEMRSKLAKRMGLGATIIKVRRDDDMGRG